MGIASSNAFLFPSPTINEVHGRQHTKSVSNYNSFDFFDLGIRQVVKLGVKKIQTNYNLERSE